MVYGDLQFFDIIIFAVIAVSTVNKPSVKSSGGVPVLKVAENLILPPSVPASALKEIALQIKYSSFFPVVRGCAI